MQYIFHDNKTRLQFVRIEEFRRTVQIRTLSSSVSLQEEEIKKLSLSKVIVKNPDHLPLCKTIDVYDKSRSSKKNLTK